MDAMRTTDVFNARFGQAEEAHLAFTYEIADGPGDILHRHGWVHPMLVEQIDVIDAEPEKRCVSDLANVFGPTIGSVGHPLHKVPTKFRRHNGLVPAPLKRPTEEFLVGIGAISLCSVEEVDPDINCAMDGGDRLRLIRFTVEVAHPHTAEAKGRDLKPLLTERSCFHCMYPFLLCCDIS